MVLGAALDFEGEVGVAVVSAFAGFVIEIGFADADADADSDADADADEDKDVDADTVADAVAVGVAITIIVAVSVTVTGTPALHTHTQRERLVNEIVLFSWTSPREERRKIRKEIRIAYITDGQPST